MTRFWISLEQGVELVIKVLKEATGGEKVAEEFSYSSGNNTEWLSVEDIRGLLKANHTSGRKCILYLPRSHLLICIESS